MIPPGLKRSTASAPATLRLIAPSLRQGQLNEAVTRLTAYLAQELDEVQAYLGNRGRSNPVAFDNKFHLHMIRAW